MRQANVCLHNQNDKGMRQSFKKNQKKSERQTKGVRVHVPPMTKTQALMRSLLKPFFLIFFFKLRLDNKIHQQVTNSSGPSRVIIYTSSSFFFFFFHITDAGSSPRCGKGFFFFSQSQLSMQTVLRCPNSPRVQSHASTYVCTLTIQITGIPLSAWTHANAAHTDTDSSGYYNAALAAAVLNQ